MKKKKLAVVISLATIFGLTSCKEAGINPKETITETVTEETKDTDDAKMAYSVLNSEMSYESFLDKLDVYREKDFKVYSIYDSDLVFSFVFKNGVKYSYARSIAGSNKNLRFYRYGDYNSWNSVGEINIKSDETIVYVNKNILDDESNQLSFKDYKLKTLEEKLMICLLGHNKGTSLCKNQNEYDFNHSHKVNIIVEENNQEVGKIIYTYKDFKPLGFVEYVLDSNNDYVINQKQDYFYNEKNNKIGEERYQNINNELYKVYESRIENNILWKRCVETTIIENDIYTTLIEKIYEGGKEIGSVKSRYINDEWAIIQQTSMINGKECSMLEVSLDSNENFSHKYEFTYNDNGKKILQIYSQYKDGTWALDEKTEYFYDDEGEIVSSIKSKYIDGAWLVVYKGNWVAIGYYLTEFSISFGASNENIMYKSEYKYDDNNKEILEIVSKFEDGIWNLSSKQETIYDDLGNTTVITSKYENGSWVYKSKSEDILNEYGDIKSHTYSEYENGAWVYKSKTEYTYFSRGEESSIIKSEFKDNDWHFISKVEWAFDENGKKISKSTFELIDNRLEEVERYRITADYVKLKEFSIGLNYWDHMYHKHEYTYDENDSLTTETDSIYIDGAWVLVNSYQYIGNQHRVPKMSISLDDENKPESKTEYTHDDLGNTTSIIYSDYKDGEWVYTGKYEYEYNNAGKQTLALYSSFKDGNFVPSSKTKYTYDSLGNTASIIYSKYKDGEWVYTSKYEYENNNAGKHTLELYSSFKDGNFVPSSKTKWTYDSLGNCILEVVSKYNDSWVYYSKTEFKYNDKGKKTLEIHYTFVNGSWAYNFKNEYEYDLAGNRVSTNTFKWVDGAWKQA